MHWVAYGPHALLVYFAEQPGDAAFAKCGALLRKLQESPPEGLVEFTPGFTSLLLEFNPTRVKDLASRADQIVDDLRQAEPIQPDETPLVEIPVIYDGPDLDRVADHNRISRAEVAALHAEAVYKVYLLGFAPGFPYLGDLNPKLHTPRLATPRAKVPAGSVAIGGQHTGIYSVETPGGWNLIGRTTLRLFSPVEMQSLDAPATKVGSGAATMFRLHAGQRVKFVPVHG